MKDEANIRGIQRIAKTIRQARTHGPKARISREDAVTKAHLDGIAVALAWTVGDQIELGPWAETFRVWENITKQVREDYNV